MNDTIDREQSKNFWMRVVWISGICVVVPPMIGLVGTVIGMVGAFGKLQASGAADPSALAGDISFALLTTLWGMIFSVVAVISFIISLVIFLKKRRLCATPPMQIEPQHGGGAKAEEK